MLWQSKSIIRLLTILPILFSSVVNAEEITTYRQQRYRNVDGQSSWVSCGPATLASLFQYYYNIPISEKEAIKISKKKEKKCKKYVDQKQKRTEAFSFCALEETLKEKNFITKRRKNLDIKAIKKYFSVDDQPPIILHLKEPNKHFIAAIEIVQNKLIIADPSEGQYLLDLSKLKNKKKISGKVLFLNAPTSTKRSNARRKQAEVVKWVKQRLKQFETIKNIQ